jgi:hypothetical protein
MFHWRRQPPFDVEQRPFTRYVLPGSPQQEFMVDIIKQTFDAVAVTDAGGVVSVGSGLTHEN